MSDSNTKCRSCNQSFVGDYCNYCGQPLIHRFNLSYLWKLLHQDLLEVDRGLWRTFKELMVRPGLMIREYLNGKTKPYFSPIKYLLVWITLFYLVSSIANTFEPQPDVNTTDLFWKDKYFFNDNAAFSWSSVSDFGGIINVVISKNLSLYFLILLPFIAWVSRFMFREINFTEHLIIWTFMWGHIIASLMLAFPIAIIPWALFTDFNMVVFMSAMGVTFILMFYFFTKAYKQITNGKWMSTVIKLLGSVYGGMFLCYGVSVLIFIVLKLLLVK